MRILLFAILFAAAGCASSQLAPGKYSGDVKSSWSKDGRTMTLLEDFSYLDPRNRTWTAPSGSKVNGASIPQIAWSLIGGPLEGRYRDSSVIHDVGCEKRWASWELVHQVFYEGMLTSGVEPWRAHVMFKAVYYFGPRWERVVQVAGIPNTQTPVARQRALQDAADGSEAQILQVVPPYIQGLPEQPATFTIRIIPPVSTMGVEDLRALARELEVKAKEGSPIPLPAEIRTFR